MKNFLSFIFAGIIGGLIAFGAIQYTNQSNPKFTEQSLSRQVNLVNQKPTAGNFPGDFTEAAKKAMPVVVHIKATASAKSSQNNNQNPFGGFFGEDIFPGSPRPQSGAGSGVFISSDGYIVTNNHVVSFADELEVTTYDNRTFKAKLIGTEPRTDLAVIKIEATNMPTLNYADSDKAQVGEWVLAVGNPFDLTSTVTAGIISAKGRDINIIGRNGNGIESFIQTDAAVNPGNSGGALVDDSGRLLGINTAIATQTGSYAGYSFAIPGNMMRKIVDDIIQYGSYQRAFLGISINDMDAELSSELGVDISQGVFVEGLADGGAASYAGILPRDIITAVDNRPVKTVPELQEIVGTAKVGDVLNITINRKGKVKDIPVKLKAEQR